MIYFSIVYALCRSDVGVSAPSKCSIINCFIEHCFTSLHVSSWMATFRCTGVVVQEYKPHYSEQQPPELQHLYTWGWPFGWKHVVKWKCSMKEQQTTLHLDGAETPKSDAFVNFLTRKQAKTWLCQSSPLTMWLNSSTHFALLTFSISCCFLLFTHLPCGDHSGTFLFRRQNVDTFVMPIEC